MSEFRELELIKIVPSKSNPRTEFDSESLRELSLSIIEHGVLQPIIVRPFPDKKAKKDGVFELVCGERRYRSCILGGVETIPASIRDLTDDEVFELQIIENLERKDVHPMDEAMAFKKMLESGKYTMEDIAAKFAKNMTFVAQRLKLNDLIPELKEDFLKGEFGIGHAVLLARIGHEDQKGIFDNSKKQWNGGYGTVKDLKDDIEGENNNLDEAIFPLADSQLLPKAGACFNCPKNSMANPVLFPDEKDTNTCFDKACYKEKEEIFYYQKVQSVIIENPGIIIVDNSWNPKREIVEEVLKENNKIVLKSWSEFSEDDDSETDAFHLNKLEFVKITLKEGAKTQDISIDPQENIKSEISKIKERAARSLELDREKIMARINTEVIEKENSILINSEILNEEEIPAFLMALYEKGSWEFREWARKEFDISDISSYGNSGVYDKLSELKFSVNDQNRFFRGFIIKNLPSANTLDFGKSSNAKAVYDYVNVSYPKEIELFTLEQNAVAEKRIAKSDQKIGDLKSSLEKTIINLEEIEQKCRVCGCTENDCSQCIEKTGYACHWVENDLCSACVEILDAEFEPSTDVTDLPTFEKITRKSKFSLNNSYFKNCNSQTEPITPYEVMGYFKQHGELPFAMDPETNPNWLYETYIEFQKRAGVYNSQFFTPASTAERIAELADQYFTTVGIEPYVLDACCGFGMLTKPLCEKGFIVKGIDNNSEILKMYSEFTGCISEQKDINSYMSNDPKWMNIIANPPYEIKELTQFFKLLYDLLENGGLSILLLPKGFVDKQKPKALFEVLSYFTILHREDMKESFARTGISAEIVVLEKA